MLGSTTMSIRHFFYPERQPALSDIVVAHVKEIRDVAVYGSLPAYGDLEFMMPTSEINVRRGKRIADYVRVGENIVTQVISTTGGKIDTSMKLVREEEAKEAMDRHIRTVVSSTLCGAHSGYLLQRPTSKRYMKRIYGHWSMKSSSPSLSPFVQEVRFPMDSLHPLLRRL